MQKIGIKIKQARTAKRITQEDLARAIGVSDKSISAYESGRVSPPFPVLEKIADSTDHSLHFFVEDSPESTLLAKLNEVEKLFQEIKKLLEEK